MVRANLHSVIRFGLSLNPRSIFENWGLAAAIHISAPFVYCETHFRGVNPGGPRQDLDPYHPY